ncbi:MAG: hypothetical protein JW842_01995 [Prolixibacteraceae bacterium]|nr:hypothetical protein [Prolixibacteraceae bacterium]
MKKLIFTLMMMAGLALVAGTAMAVNETEVYRGGTYTYNLNGIKVVNTAANVIIDYAGDASETITINSGFVTGTPLTAPVGDDYVANFNIKFSTSATIGLDTLTVEISDQGTNGCSNWIIYEITVLADPTIDLAIVADEDQYCQETTNNTNNEAASLGSTNEISFDVTPTITNTGSNDYTYTYTLDIPVDGETSFNTYLISYGGSGTFDEATGVVSNANAASGTTESFTITFNTTTGLDVETITGTIESGASITMTASNASFNETVTDNNEDIVTVNRTPSIGSFVNP